MAAAHALTRTRSLSLRQMVARAGCLLPRVAAPLPYLPAPARAAALRGAPVPSPAAVPAAAGPVHASHCRLYSNTTRYLLS